MNVINVFILDHKLTAPSNHSGGVKIIFGRRKIGIQNSHSEKMRPVIFLEMCSSLPLKFERGAPRQPTVVYLGNFVFQRENYTYNEKSVSICNSIITFTKPAAFVLISLDCQMKHNCTSHYNTIMSHVKLMFITKYWKLSKKTKLQN